MAEEMLLFNYLGKSSVLVLLSQDNYMCDMFASIFPLFFINYDRTRRFTIPHCDCVKRLSNIDQFKVLFAQRANKGPAGRPD